MNIPADREDRIIRPSVSIVTPTYNRARLLPETIESILNQTFQDFEYLIIDDGSTDDTESLVRSYGGRIAYYRHANVGEARSTNRGWRLARGRYFAMVSSDDPMLPTWLEQSVPFLDARPDVIVGYPDWRVIDDQSRTVEEIKTFDYSFDNMVAWLYTMPGPGALVRRDALADLQDLRDPSYRFVPDLECWLRLGLRGNFARIPFQLATWRRHPTSITVADRSLVRAREMIRLVKSYFRRRDLPPHIRAHRRSALSRAYWLASWIVSETHPLRSALYLRKSYQLVPNEPPDFPERLKRLPYEPDGVRKAARGLLRKLVLHDRIAA
jgi:glycosyltransferase involved in cell wall biosynthesis